MKIETDIKKILHHNSEIDTDEFLQRFHSYRADRYHKRSRTISGLAALVVLIFLSTITIEQISTPSNFNQTESMNNRYTTELTEDVYSELAYYLLDESDDVWETVAFLYDIDYEPITELIKGGS